MNYLPLGLWMVVLLNAFSAAAGENIIINPWQIQAPTLEYDNLNANVDDTITFIWDDDENHTVHINPTGNCLDTSSISIGDSSPVDYTFSELDAVNTALGKPVYFTDNFENYCEWGMRFSVNVTERTLSPTASPTASPSSVPSQGPTKVASSAPSSSPTKAPTDAPTADPSMEPTLPPTVAPSPAPSDGPTSTPTISPSEQPSNTGSEVPSLSSAPSVAPIEQPSSAPSDAPSSTPTVTVTNAPTAPPVDFPTDPPTPGPTSPPTSQPTMGPTSTPTKTPTKNPTEEPVVEPTLSPINGEPIPTDSPEEEISQTFNELRMGMAGVTNLTADARLAWEELTGDFTTSFVFNDLKDDVSNFETSFKVTNVEPFEEGRRHQRMMRGESEPSRGLQETQQEVIIVVYIQTVKYNTIDASRFTPDIMVTGPFATTDERSAYVTLLKSSSNPELSQIKGVSEIQVPVQTAAPTAAPIVEAFALSTPVIIGIACGGAGFLILVILFCIYCRSGSSDGSDAKSSEDPPLHVDVRADEVSTLAGPDGPPTYGDRSVATVDYDYSKAYGGAGDTSVSSAGGTFGSNTQNISFPNNAAATGAALGAMDENSYDAQYDNPGIRNGDEEIIHIFAPPGKLGVVIDTPDDGAPVVHAVKDTSVIADRIVVGDKLVAVDDEDVRSMTAIKVSKMISRKGANPSRKLTIVRSAAQ